MESGPPKPWTKTVVKASDTTVVSGGSRRPKVRNPRTAPCGGIASGQSLRKVPAVKVSPDPAVRKQFSNTGRRIESSPSLAPVISTRVKWAVSSTACTVRVSGPAVADVSSTSRSGPTSCPVM
jgi:hypothetical protein